MMATFQTSRPAPFGAITTYRVVSFFSAALETMARWNARRATIKALRGLSAHELNDIGLSQADIDAMSRRGEGLF